MRSVPLFRVVMLALGMSWILLAGTGLAVDQATPGGPATSVSADTLDAKIEEVEATAGLGDELKAKLTELYRKTLSSLEKAKSDKASADAFQKAKQSAPAQAREIREKLEQTEKIPPEQGLKLYPETPPQELQQQLLKEKADLAAVEAKLAELENKLSVETDRPDVVHKRLTEAKQRNDDIAAELKLPAPKDENPLLTEARRWKLDAEAQALSAEIRKLDQELLSQPMRLELLNAQRDKASNSVDFIRKRVRMLEEAVNQRRSQEAVQAKEEAETVKREAWGKHPLVQELAKKNAALSEQVSAWANDLERVSAADDIANERANEIDDAFRSARQKLEITGMSAALGQVLVDQKRDLPKPREFRKEERAREKETAAVSLRQIQHLEERRQLRNVTDYVAELTAGLPPEKVEQIRDDLIELVSQRRELLDKAISIDNAYQKALAEADIAQRHLSNVARAYNEFLAERLLWIRSSPLPNLKMLRGVAGQVARLLSPGGWLEVYRALLYQFGSSPVPTLVLALFALLVLKDRRFRLDIVEAGNSIGRPSTDRFAYTFRALILTLLRALKWPLLLGGLGWQLGESVEATLFTKAISNGLIWVSPPLFYLRAFRLMCDPGGLADRHFRWPKVTLKHLRRQFNRLMALFLPTAFVAVVVIELEWGALGSGLGRLMLLLTLLALALFFFRLFDPKTGVLRVYMERHPDSPIARLQYLWLALAVAVPLALAGLALVGYVYTAGVLTARLADTLWLGLGLVVIQQLVTRWLTVIRRRIAFKKAMERRQAERAAAAGDESGEAQEGGAAGVLAEDIEEPEIDLVAMSKESVKLLNTALIVLALLGVFAIWADVLPAFGVLDRITLWHQTAVVGGEQKILPVTLADALLALLILVVTAIAVQRFPSLLEFVLLQRFSMTPGGRYTAVTLLKYVIIAVGILAFFNVLGGSWAKIQWLVAALGVGIGFGLQEIVANFISGIIILFERPIRVGDIVTIGDTDGVVTRIQIRATTIRNWNRQELLVPNKEFITGRLLNWTLSDQMTRVVIVVGVAYGSDVDRALELMAEAAREHEHVLEDPEPILTFEGFDDNSLRLILRAYLASIDYRISTISELHSAINRKFEAAGISIAFPQRDVHLDTSRPLDIRLRRERGNGGERADG